MTTTQDTWILVTVPGGRGARRPVDGLAVRAALALLGWASRNERRAPRTVELARAPRPAAVQRPFC